MSGQRTVGFVGLGAMGSPMSRHLLEAGWRVVGYDSAASALERHRANGGETVDDPADLRGQTDVVVTSLPTAGALRATLDRLASSATEAPLRVVEVSTLSLGEKEAARDQAERAGMRLLDCPVSGTSAQAERGDLIIYASGGDRDDEPYVRPVLTDMSRQIYDVGPFGDGTKLKLVANLLVAIHNLSSAEALLLADRADLDLEAVLPALVDGAGSSRMLEVRGPLMVAGDYEHATARVEVFRKDLRAIRDLADGLGVPTPLLSVTSMMYDAAAGQGRAHQDTASVYAVVRRLAGAPE
jgi:3-hydroxyisobutyrate dehydrogenase-like beta-hydroxyacid dehydrogenase